MAFRQTFSAETFISKNFSDKLLFSIKDCRLTFKLQGFICLFFVDKKIVYKFLNGKTSGGH